MGWEDRDYYRDDRGDGGLLGRITRRSVVTWLLVLNVVVFLWDGIFGASARGQAAALDQYFYFSINKALFGLQLWRWVTYQFIHADIWHLFFNMLGLFFFGPMVEQWWGSRRFLVFYLLCGMSGALVYTLLSWVPGLFPASGALIGASGSVFGILAAAATVAPRQRVMLLFPPIPMQIRTLVLVFLGIAVVKVLVGHINAGGEAAHLGGALLGYLLVKQRWLLSFADTLAWRVKRRSEGSWQKKIERQRREEEAEQAEVDRILDKVRDHGLHSLTRGERKALQRATDRQRRAG